jgi:outer membrane murein-binding lipoprotein Lpp
MASKKAGGAANKKGLSMDEKVVKVEQYLQDHPIPFTLKELESILPKATGVIHQSVLECLDQLVSEGRAESAKVGVHVLFWYFAAAKTQLLEQQLQSLTRRSHETEIQLQQLELQLASSVSAAAGCGNHNGADERQERLQLNTEIQQLTSEQSRLNQQVSQLDGMDAASFAMVGRHVQECRDAANRWTNNIFLLEQTVGRRMGMSSYAFRQRYRIPHDMDFLLLSC